MTKSSRTLVEVAATDYTGGIHILRRVEVVGMIVVEEDMIVATKRRRRLPTDLHPPGRAQGRFLLVSGSSIVEMRLVSRPERKLLRDPVGLHIVRGMSSSTWLKKTYMKPRVRHMLVMT